MTFMRTLESVKMVSNVDYIVVDINCRLKVVLKSGRSKSFSNNDSFNEIIEQDTIK